MKDPILETVDGRSVLRFERRLSHPVEKVWRALTEPAELKHWFPSSVEMELKVGAKISFYHEKYSAYEDGEILDLDPPRVFAYSWNDSILRWELSPAPEGSLLVFTQTFDDAPYAASYAAGWTACLAAMAKRLAGSPGSNQPFDYPAEHEEFSAKFGLGQGRVVERDGTWHVEIDRLLPWPEEKVLAAFGSDLADWEAESQSPAGTRVRRTGSAPSQAEAARTLSGWRERLDAVASTLA